MREGKRFRIGSRWRKETTGKSKLLAQGQQQGLIEDACSHSSHSNWVTRPLRPQHSDTQIGPSLVSRSHCIICRHHPLVQQIPNSCLLLMSVYKSPSLSREEEESADQSDRQSADSHPTAARRKWLHSRPNGEREGRLS